MGEVWRTDWFVVKADRSLERTQTVVRKYSLIVQKQMWVALAGQMSTAQVVVMVAQMDLVVVVLAVRMDLLVAVWVGRMVHGFVEARWVD